VTLPSAPTLRPRFGGAGPVSGPGPLPTRSARSRPAAIPAAPADPPAPLRSAGRPAIPAAPADPPAPLRSAGRPAIPAAPADPPAPLRSAGRPAIPAAPARSASGARPERGRGPIRPRAGRQGRACGPFGADPVPAGRSAASGPYGASWCVRPGRDPLRPGSRPRAGSPAPAPAGPGPGPGRLRSRDRSDRPRSVRASVRRIKDFDNRPRRTAHEQEGSTDEKRRPTRVRVPSSP
jgi:translation initiation factor IF-2